MHCDYPVLNIGVGHCEQTDLTVLSLFLLCAKTTERAQFSKVSVAQLFLVPARLGKGEMYWFLSSGLSEKNTLRKRPFLSRKNGLFDHFLITECPTPQTESYQKEISPRR